MAILYLILSMNCLGAIFESDVLLAEASDAVIIGFW